MGAEFQVGSLEEMCDLMCNNEVPTPKLELLSIEEAIKQLKKCKSFHNGSYGEALNMAIKALEQTRWIPVSESLPEEHTSVIGTTEFNDIYEAELYNNCGKSKWYADSNYDVPIVAWMPLPKPYRAESEDK